MKLDVWFLVGSVITEASVVVGSKAVEDASINVEGSSRVKLETILVAMVDCCWKVELIESVVFRRVDVAEDKMDVVCIGKTDDKTVESLVKVEVVHMSSLLVRLPANSDDCVSAEVVALVVTEVESAYAKLVPDAVNSISIGVIELKSKGEVDGGSVEI